jgi:CRP-like cAMP-binding protein
MAFDAEKGSGGKARESLSNIGLLTDLPSDAVHGLERQAQWTRYAAGAQIISRESGPEVPGARDAMFVVQGAVRIVSYSKTGREVAYAVVPEGGYFGELSALDGQPRSANAVAETACLIASLSPSAFRGLLTDYPGVALRLIERLVHIIRDCDERIMDLATLGAYQRVYREILKRAKPDPLRAGSWLVYPLPTQLDIASYASTTRETVARVLSSLTSSDICARKGKTLYIRNRDQLEQLIEPIE